MFALSDWWRYDLDTWVKKEADSGELILTWWRVATVTLTRKEWKENGSMNGLQKQTGPDSFIGNAETGPAYNLSGRLDISP